MAFHKNISFGFLVQASIIELDCSAPKKVRKISAL
jgi:hypothetical protein